MKKLIILTLALSLVIAGIAVATVVSSKHDLRLDAAYTSANSSQVCLFCHHPHRGSSTATTDLLWNIKDTANDYPTYASIGANSVGISGDNLGKTGNAVSSLLCMGCHDGATTNTFVKTDWADAANMTETPNDFVTPGQYADLGSTLADDHPIDFTYPTVAAIGNDIKVKGSGAGVLGLYSGINYPTFGGTMQCATCHNVHNGDSPLVQFMRGTGSANDIITDSKICRDCHTSK